MEIAWVHEHVCIHVEWKLHVLMSLFEAPKRKHKTCEFSIDKIDKKY